MHLGFVQDNICRTAATIQTTTTIGTVTIAPIMPGLKWSGFPAAVDGGDNAPVCLESPVIVGVV